jgi:hypothetical protein
MCVPTTAPRRGISVYLKFQFIVFNTTWMRENQPRPR